MSGHQAICNRRSNNDVFKHCRNVPGLSFTVKAYVSPGAQPGEFQTTYGSAFHVGTGRAVKRQLKWPAPETYRVRVTPKPRSAPL